MLIERGRAFIDRHVTAIVWILRIVVGATFVFSGFAKSVDPWGFIFKMRDYLEAWHMGQMPDEVMLVGAAAISITEFTVGMMLLLGCMRTVLAWLAFLIMCVMLPLTAYILIASPVDDCGCFGDAFVISNTATFVKNIFLFVFAYALGRLNGRVPGVYPHIMQWLVCIACVAYALVLVIVGYFMQPMVDFRPYPVGSSLISDVEGDIVMVYEKDGKEKAFTINDLPGDDWTFVRREEVQAQGHDKLLAVFDGNEDITSEAFADEGAQAVLIVTNPSNHARARASMANKINDYITSRGGSMIGLVALAPEKIDEWKEVATPDFDVYSAEDTSLKEVARGDAAIVYLKDGVIQWKRNIYSFPGDFPDYEYDGNVLEDDIWVPDSGSWIKWVTIIFLGFLLVVWIPCAPFVLKSKKHKNQ